ncbi:hypothetical protein I4U23_028504 [Adineta vaga]|nr:hypothetical protein I4U23_028504 [Adineta vaga]
MALLKGPDTEYKNLLIENNQMLNTTRNKDQYRNRNSFLQIHVRPLTAKQQRHRHYQPMKKHDKSLRFTFPISYTCPIKYRKRLSSPTSNSSLITTLH